MSDLLLIIVGSVLVGFAVAVVALRSFTKRKNARWGSYPCCDFVNNAIRFILDGEADCAVEELLQAIWRADGYIYDDLQERVNEDHKRYWDDRKEVT